MTSKKKGYYKPGLGEHLHHARTGRDAPESDGEHGRGVWEQGEGVDLRGFRAYARFFHFWYCVAGGNVI